MPEQKFTRLGQAMLAQQGQILATWRTQVAALESARGLDVPTLNDHMGGILSAITSELLGFAADGALHESSTSHGMQRRWIGFDIVEVVAEYKAMRAVLGDFCQEDGRATKVVNRVIDDAIAVAVESYAGEQMAELQRYRAERAAFVTHDLRTPLAAIHTAAVGMERTGSGTPKLVAVVQRNVRRLDQLITRFLDEQTAPETSPNIAWREVDLWPVIEDLRRDLSPLATEAQNVIDNLVDEDVVVWADPALVGQIFQNLISNAIKHTTGGRIEIGASLLQDQSVSCHVSDTGSGITEDRLSKIFDKFETDGSGTGLGLAIVKKAIEAHGSTIAVESRVGFGTTFRFLLPGIHCRTLPAPLSRGTASS